MAEEKVEYRRVKNSKAPFPRVEYKCSNCGFVLVQMMGYETDEYGNPQDALCPPTGKCMKCHKEIEVVEGSI